MARATKGLGTTISIGGVGIGNLTDINGTDTSVETMEVSTLDSSTKDYITGLDDSGEVSISGFYEPGNAGQAALFAAKEGHTEDTYIITFPASMGAAFTFTGLLTKVTTGAGMSDPVSFEATILLTSAVTVGTTPSTGASALVVTEAGGGALTAVSFAPSFAIGTYNYSVQFTTETAYVIKVTAASHTLKLYADNVFVETLVSGSESSSIAQAAAGSKSLKVICYETGKTPITYNLMVSKVS